LNKRLFVGGIPFSTTKDELASLFSQVGTVADASIIADRFTAESKGFGFVEMETEEGAEAAIAKFNGYDLGGRKLSVAEARPMEPRKSEGRGGFGGGRRSFGGRREGGRGGFGRDGRGGGGRRRGGFQGRGGR
jgi:RNA recognition motif-containing protein